MFNFDAYVVVVVIVAASLWTLIGLARLNNAWRVSQAETVGLRQQRTDDAKALLASVEEIMKLEAELKDTKQRANFVEQARDIKKGELEKLVPPPPPSIYVTSEFPPSSRDRPWTALLRRTSAKSSRKDEPSERYVLVWAQDQTAAQGRAQSALTGHPGFAIDGVIRYS